MVILIVLGAIGLIIWLSYDIYNWVEYGESPTFIIVLTIFQFLMKLPSKHKIKNELYQCYDCEKLYRQYQMSLTKENHETERCPHCDKYKPQWGDQDKRLYEYHKGLDFHPDCPKVNWWNHMKIKNVAKQLRKNEKQMELDKFFQEYNKIEVDLSWIENLKKNRER